MKLYLEYPPTLGGSYIGTDSKEGNGILKNILFTLLDGEEYGYQVTCLNDWRFATLSWDYLHPGDSSDCMDMEHFLSIVEGVGFTVVYFKEKEMEKVRGNLYKDER